jgi:hypothetical protein
MAVAFVVLFWSEVEMDINIPAEFVYFVLEAVAGVRPIFSKACVVLHRPRSPHQP